MSQARGNERGGEGEQGARGERDAELGRGAHQLVAHNRAADDRVGALRRARASEWRGTAAPGACSAHLDRDLRVGDVDLGDAIRTSGSTSSAAEGCGSYQNQRKMMTTLK